MFAIGTKVIVINPNLKEFYQKKGYITMYTDYRKYFISFIDDNEGIFYHKDIKIDY